MIHVPFGHEAPPQNWLERAQTLSEQLNHAATKQERDQIINANRTLWGELKNWLLGFSKGKCWFSEAKDTFSHLDVEHFRPKASAKDLDGNEREGYWWLAFDWHNYRICGNVGNRKKGTFFPLAQDCIPATCDARHRIEDELFVLLDPTREGDPDLISFDERGLAKATPGIGLWPQLRANTSIERYKLNGYEPLRKARQKLWDKCRQKIEQAAQEFLLSKGIKLVMVPHFKKTYFDGAALLDGQGVPIIALTGRYDRLDNFWFTLAHELAHLVLGHVYDAEGQCIVDDLDQNTALDEKEMAADKCALEALMPKTLWERHPARKTCKIKDVISLAGKADIHPAIIAGRIRREQNNYRLLSKFVGHGEVRKQLPS